MVRENKSSHISSGEPNLIRKAVKKAQMSSHAVNNAIAVNNLAKKWVAALAAVKTAMNKQANANYEKARDEYSRTKTKYETAKRWLAPYGSYDTAKAKFKSAEKNLKGLEKHRK